MTRKLRRLSIEEAFAMMFGEFQFRPVWRAIGACADNAPIWFLQAECDGDAKVWADDEVPYCMIETPIGRVKAEAGDWIGRNVDGYYYVRRENDK